MGRKRQRRYTAEFKSEAMRLVCEEGLSVKQAAEDLGMARPTLSRWLMKVEGPVVCVEPTNEPPDVELMRLRSRVRELEMDREILKKAAAFFARESE